MVMQAYAPRPKIIGKSPVALAKAGTVEFTLNNAVELFNKFQPMLPKLCPQCGIVHVHDWPHDRDSFTYQYTFQQTHKRPPTWSDAMVHCSRRGRVYWREKIRRAYQEAGIELPADLAIELDPKIDD